MDVDAPAEIAAIKERLSGTIPGTAFAMELTKFLARFGDGQSRLDVDPDDVFDRGYLPFLIGVAGDRLVAFHSDRRRLLDPDFPFVVQMFPPSSRLAFPVSVSPIRQAARARAAISLELR